MQLAIRDHKILQMKAELENRKKILCVKRHQLKNNAKENDLLKFVLTDYEKYNTHIISQKEKQIMFLERLNDYIDNINIDLKLTDNKLKESKQEQREILKEITYLKDEIDNLVEPTRDNNSDNSENNYNHINSNDNIDE
tara:strand:- start:16 stop:432 length:417 start_codon:yes stop_codon:yes gene_type:complete